MTKAHTNIIIVILNWLHLGRPRVCPQLACLGTPLNGDQIAYVARIEHMSQRCFDLGSISAPQLGRTCGKVESVSHLLVALMEYAKDVKLELDPYSNSRTNHDKFFDTTINMKDTSSVKVGTLDSAVLQVAKDVEPARIGFKTPRPNFDPRRLYQGETLEAYEDPAVLEIPAKTSRLPRPRFRASHQNKMGLFSLLDGVGRLAIFCLSWITNTLLVNGLFAVIKDSLKDRLISDARVPNAHERGLKYWT